MGKCVIMLEGKFMQWSSVTDAPESPLLSEDLFTQYWKDEYGRSGVIDFPRVMETTKQRGCSYGGMTVNEVISNNRAGEKEKKLTKAQIIKAYDCSPEEFAEWSKGRDKAFADMAIEFGPDSLKNKKPA